MKETSKTNEKPIIVSAAEFLGILAKNKGKLIETPIVVTEAVEINNSSTGSGDDIYFKNITFRHEVEIGDITFPPIIGIWIESSKFCGSLNIKNTSTSYFDMLNCRVGDNIFFTGCNFGTLGLENVYSKSIKLASTKCSDWLGLRKVKCSDIEIACIDIEIADEELPPLETPYVVTDDPVIAEQFRLFQIPVAMPTAAIRAMMAKKKTVGMAR